MPIPAASILSRATTILQDTTNVRWPMSELTQWFNDAQREIVLLKPEASVLNTPVQLQTGNTKQTLPASAIRLIDIVRNLGADGLTPGAAVRIVAREVLDSQRPNWHSEAGQSVIKHFVFDPRDPRTFYVYPKPSSAVYLETVYSVAPAEVTESGGVVSGNLALDDIYSNAVLDYVLYRAYSKDAEYASNGPRAAAHYQAFANAIGMRTNTDLDRSPTMHSPLNPNYPMPARPAA